MKISSLAVFLLASSITTGKAAKEEERNNNVRQRKASVTKIMVNNDVEIDIGTSDVKTSAVEQCPNSYTPGANGYPQYDVTCGECECTEGDYTLKEDIGEPLGQPGCYRCALADGASCSTWQECSATRPIDNHELACQDGYCFGVNGVLQCPSQGSLCEYIAPCECATGNKIDVGGGNVPSGCYKCSAN